MTGLVEQYALQLGWRLAKNNVLVEGTSDVAILGRASELHEISHGRPVEDDDFAILAAGRGDDGGVDGVNRGLISFRQIADADRDAAGRTRYRFIGLFDNDYAGRSAFSLASRFDPRVERYRDIFLLHPVMPEIGDGLSDRLIEATQANMFCSGMDWEIEDLCSEKVWSEFERVHPSAIVSKSVRRSHIHYELKRSMKGKFVKHFLATAEISDVAELLRLLKLLRGYLGLPHEFILA